MTLQRFWKQSTNGRILMLDCFLTEANRLNVSRYGYHASAAVVYVHEGNFTQGRKAELVEAARVLMAQLGLDTTSNMKSVEDVVFGRMGNHPLGLYPVLKARTRAYVEVQACQEEEDWYWAYYLDGDSVDGGWSLSGTIPVTQFLLKEGS